MRCRPTSALAQILRLQLRQWRSLSHLPCALAGLRQQTKHWQRAITRRHPRAQSTRAPLSLIYRGQCSLVRSDMLPQTQLLPIFVLAQAKQRKWFAQALLVPHFLRNVSERVIPQASITR